MTTPAAPDIEDFDAIAQDRLPGHLGLRITEVGTGRVAAEFDVRPHHLAPNGYLHAASVIALADTAAGYGCVASLPPGASGFTTLELKCNFLGTATEGRVRCEGRAVHLGRTTQVWDVTVTADGQPRPIALFRCTQVVLWPK